MKHTNKYLRKVSLLIGLVLVFASSCKKDWLDKKTNIGIATPATLKDFQALLDNGRTSLLGEMNGGSCVLGQIGFDDFYITEASFPPRSEMEKNAYTWSKTFTYNNVSDWSKAYGRIVVCNVILEGLSKIDAKSSQQDYNNIKGQALFQRARSFYELSQIWAPPYNEKTATTDLGIPLRLEADINIQSVRSTVNETYEQILSDLNQANGLLPPKSPFITRASKIAVQALLARIYLSMENYSKALEHANASLTIYDQLLSYSDIIATAAAPFADNNKEIIFTSRMSSVLISGSLARIPQDFRNLYTENDLRSTAFFGTSAGLITFKGNYSGSASSRFNGLATDEQYLIRAECYARANKPVEAMKDLNDLLRTRWRKIGGVSTYVDQIATDSEDALRKILLERRKQLLMRGLRSSDLRRLNRDDRFKEAISRTIEGSTYTLEPNSYKYTFPIPDDVIQLSGMEQNMGW